MPIKYKTLAIINNKSGVGKQKNILDIFDKNLDKQKFDLHTVNTEYAGHATVLAKKAVEDNYAVVLSVGGDGTINEIARGLLHSNVIMGIVPCGSGNGLARYLKIPMDIIKAVKWLNLAEPGLMDTISVNDFLSVNVGGLGFDALVSHKFSKMKKRGYISYVKVVLREFLRYKNSEYIINADGKEIKFKGFLLSFANSSQYGNNAFIAPNALIDDGYFNLVLLRKPNLYQAFDILYKMRMNILDFSKLFYEIKVSEADIYHDTDIGHVDGEPVVFGKKVHLKLLANSLRVFRK